MPITQHHTTCLMDCPDCCSLAVTVEDGALRGVAAAPGNPDTQGFICHKVAHFDRHFRHPERILRPLRRVGPKGAGRFTPVSWDEALDEIAARLREVASTWGAEAILPYHYGGSNGKVTDDLLDQLLFRRLGASRLARTVCAAPTGKVAIGMYGKMPGVAYADFPAAKTIVIWGANPKASHIHLVPYLKEARRQGAQVITVDPRRNFSAAEVDLHLPILPGTDLALALGLIHRWFQEGRIDHGFLDAWAQDGAAAATPLLAAAADWPLDRAAHEAGLPVDDVARLADAWAEASPALLRLGWGTERNYNGSRAVAALMAIPALLGKFGVAGGGFTMSNSGGAKLDAAAVLGPGVHDHLDAREVNMNLLGPWLTEGPAAGPPIQALFVFNCNPAATVPDQNRILAGLAREDLFTVVHEQVMTDTARFADFVLPATTFLEHHDLRVGYGSYSVGSARPLVARAGEARPNVEVFAALGRRLGFTDPAFGWSEAELADRVAANLKLTGRPLDASQRARLAAGEPLAYDFPGPRPVPFVTSFPLTPSGKIDLVPAFLGPEPYAYRSPRPHPEDPFPLTLVSPGHNGWISSSFGQLGPRLTVTLHPHDAAARGLAAGEVVRVWNPLGEVVCPLVVSDRVRPGVAAMPKGAWCQDSLNGATATALASTEVDPIAGGACFNDARVEIAAAQKV